MNSKKVLFIIGIMIIAVAVISLESLNVKNDISSIHGFEVIKIDGVFDQNAIKKANYIVTLSNQSLLESKIRMSLYVDGIKLFDEKLKVENYHKHYYYYFKSEGEHEIKVQSENSIESIEIINFELDKPIYSSIIYLNFEDEDPLILHRVSDEPFAIY